MNKYKNIILIKKLFLTFHFDLLSFNYKIYNNMIKTGMKAVK
jgi:hypothetical protein